MSSINKCSIICNIPAMKDECLKNGCKYQKKNKIDDNELTSMDFCDYDFDKVAIKDKEDIINHPSHYISGRKYEPVQVINDWGLNFNLGNVIKYISRAGRKDSMLQDLEKARFYLDYEINSLKNE